MLVTFCSHGVRRRLGDPLFRPCILLRVLAHWNVVLWFMIDPGMLWFVIVTGMLWFVIVTGM